MIQYQVKDHSIALYLNGVAHVTASVQLGDGDRVELAGIAPKFNPGTLHTILDSKKVKILEARVLEATTLDEIAEGKIGDEVYDRKFDENVMVFGVKNGQLLVKSSKGVYSEPLKSFYYKTDEDVRARETLELKLEGSSDQLKIAYLTDGITLTPHYNISLGDKLALTAEVGVDNDTGKSYKDVELDVVPGEVGVPRLPRSTRVPPIKAMLALAAGVDVVEDAGQIRYSFGKRSLPKGESRFNVFKEEGLDYRIVYKADVKGSEISTNLRFKVPITLPAGAVAVYSEREREQYEGGGTLRNVLKNKDADVKLRTPDTLEMKTEQVGETKIVKTDLGTEKAPVFALEREFKVNVNNAGKDDVTIETYLGLSETEKILDSSLEQHESGLERVRWDVKVKGGEEIVFNYKVQDLQFTPVSEEEIRSMLKSGCCLN